MTAPPPQAVEAGAGPGQETDWDEDEVVIPDVVFGMFRYGRPDDVVEAQQAIDEIHAMAAVHGAIPDQAEEQEEHDACRREQPFKVIGPALDGGKEKQEQAGQDQADRALGQDGTGSHDVSPCHIAFLPFCQADIGEKQGSATEEIQGLVSDDGAADEPENQGCHGHGGEEDGCRAAARLAQGEPGSQGAGSGAEEDSWQAGCQIRRPQEAVRQAQEPVQENGLIIPVRAVNLRGQPVAAADHFQCRQGVIRFDRVRDGQLRYADGQEKECCHEDDGQECALFHGDTS